MSACWSTSLSADSGERRKSYIWNISEYPLIYSLPEFYTVLSNPVTLKRWNMSVWTMETKGVFQFEISINVFFGSSRFMWIPIIWVCSHYKYFILTVRGSTFNDHQHLTSESDVHRVYPRTVRVEKASFHFANSLCLWKKDEEKEYISTVHSTVWACKWHVLKLVVFILTSLFYQVIQQETIALNTSLFRPICTSPVSIHAERSSSLDN